jgi:multicomponent K+:H+ antiporter subunit G
MPPLVEGLAAVLLLTGGAFALVGALGLVRLPDLFARLHGPTKATTIGIGAVVLAVLLLGGGDGGETPWRVLLIPLFLFVTAPVAAQAIARAALGRRPGAGAIRPDSEPENGN